MHRTLRSAHPTSVTAALSLANRCSCMHSMTKSGEALCLLVLAGRLLEVGLVAACYDHREAAVQEVALLPLGARPSGVGS